MPKYEWDENKNRKNKLKHFIGFETAQKTFDDPNAVEFLNKIDEERRIIRLGKTFGKVILAVVYTMRSLTVRLISARQANRKETKTYLKNSLTKQSNETDES